MARDDRRLGKGLAALLGENVDTPEATFTDLEIPLDRIRANPYQPRADFDAGAIEELAASIAENGLLQPVVVREVGEHFQVVAGERRVRAVRRLGWETVPIIVRALSDEQMLVVALVENLQRENLSPLEEALGFQRLVEDFGLTQEEVGRHVGRDRSTVSNALRLLTLPEEVKELVGEGRLSAGHGRAILGITDEDRQVEFARRAVAEGWSVRMTERRVKAAAAPDEGKGGRRGRPTRESGGSDDPATRRAELILERALGTQVRIRTAGSGGQIVVSFHDGDDFLRLLEMIAGEASAEQLG